jgi:NhaP-type Na+/H+ and K+/H+ antiporter
MGQRSSASYAALRYGPRVARTLEAESGFNDPVAILLVVGLIDWIQLPDYGAPDMALLFLRQLSIGAAVGMALGWLAVRGLRRAWLGSEAGYVIGTMGAAAVSFGAAGSLHGSSFLAVYLTGLCLGTVPIPAKRAVTVFHQGLAIVAQVTMFVVLGLLVFPSQLGGVALEGTVLAIILMFVSRPVATFASTAAARFTLQEQSVLAWAGLRGAVPVVLATFPVIDGVPDSLDFFNIVFFAVLLSTLLQGATFEPFAKSVGVTTPTGAAPWEAGPPRTAQPSAQILTARPWADADGDPAYPKRILGIEVTRQLLVRLDRPGALVTLADGRYAFTGPVLGVGSASALQAAARRRLVATDSEVERAWWREVIGVLAR